MGSEGSQRGQIGHGGVTQVRSHRGRIGKRGVTQRGHRGVTQVAEGSHRYLRDITCVV